MWDNAGAMRRITRWLTALVLLMLLGAAGVWLYHSPYFPVKQVKIEGDLKRVSTQELQTVAQRYIRGNIFSADLNGAQKAFQALRLHIPGSSNRGHRRLISERPRRCGRSLCNDIHKSAWMITPH